jgi:hypothetical protein
MPRFNVNVYSIGDQGQRTHLGETTLDADDELHAQVMAHDHLWDSRLDSASCSADYEVEEIEIEHDLTGGPTF